MRSCFVGITPGRATLALLAALAATTAGVAAQGTVTGTVVDGRTLQPISVVQVDIPILEMGGLTQANGQFLLLNVPAGTHQLRATRIGFRTATVQIEVTGGQTTRIEINLTAEALALDEVVVTGTAGGTRQRALGNAMARVEAADVAEVAPINTMQDLLQGREAGVGFKRVSGNIGTGSPIRIRGYTSLNVGNNPLIYVDGIRVDNETQAGPSLRDGRQVSKLDDINPEDIERIEVIKGPSAATLYGTEASNGVINIITKRGIEGAPQFDLTIKQGATWLPNARDQVSTAYGKDSLGDWAEAQLILAEVEVQSGDAASALGRINALRDRHGLPHATSVDMDVVIEERRRELFLEGRHHADKLRYGLWFPRGQNFNHKGVAYGPTTCLPIDETELELNPNTSG